MQADVLLLIGTAVVAVLFGIVIAPERIEIEVKRMADTQSQTTLTSLALLHGAEQSKKAVHLQACAALEAAQKTAAETRAALDAAIGEKQKAKDAHLAAINQEYA